MFSRSPTKDAPLTQSFPVRWRVPAAILCSCILLQLAWPLAMMPLHMSSDYGEGWNAYWAARAMAGAPLYTDRLAAITNNYPPLSFYIAGVAGRLAGDQIIGGRLLSLAALAACAAMVGTVVARLGGGRGGAWASAGLFLLYVASFAWRYVGSDDPQWLAAAFTLAALLVLTRGEPVPSVARVVAACALLTVGGLVKHNQLALPIAVTVWLARGDRRLLIVWLASAAAMVGAAVLLLHAAFGPVLFDQLLRHRRVFKARYFINALGSLSGLLPEMVLAGMAWRGGRAGGPDRRMSLVLAFAWTALFLGIVERFGTGVSANAHFDSAIGFAIVAGVALGRDDLLRPGLRRRMTHVALLPLVAATLVMLPRTVDRFSHLAADKARWRTAIALVRAAPGPVACELPALCYWAGRPFLVDFYNYGQKLRMDGDPARLGPALGREAFALMVVVRDARFDAGDGRLPDRYNRVIAARYRTVMVLPEHVLLLTRRG
jgi:hypothetical protein